MARTIRERLERTTNPVHRRNLEVLYRKTGRWVEGVIDPGAPAG